MKPTVLLDCDGVLSDFVSAALKLVHRLTGNEYKPEDVRTWEVFDSIPEKHMMRDVYAIMKADGGCFGLPVYEGAQDGVRRLRDFAEVIIVTSPFKGSPTWAHEREMWLEAHFGLDHVIHARRKDRIHGDFFIDDKESHVIEWCRYWQVRDPGHQGMIWKTPRMSEANLDRARGNIRVVESWDDVIEVVRTKTAFLDQR